MSPWNGRPVVTSLSASAFRVASSSGQKGVKTWRFFVVLVCLMGFKRHFKGLSGNFRRMEPTPDCCLFKRLTPVSSFDPVPSGFSLSPSPWARAEYMHLPPGTSQSLGGSKPKHILTTFPRKTTLPQQNPLKKHPILKPTTSPVVPCPDPPETTSGNVVSSPAPAFRGASLTLRSRMTAPVSGPRAAARRQQSRGRSRIFLVGKQSWKL